MRSDRLGCVGDVTQIRLVVLIQRRGYANDDRVHLLQPRIISSGAETLCFGGLNVGGRNTNNICPTLVERGNLALINIKTSDWEFLFAVEQGQRQAHIAQADDR